MIKKIIDTIKKNNKIALFQHIKPDGDSVSSSYGLCLALKEIFPKKEIVMISDYEYLKENFKFLKVEKKYFKQKVGSSYLTIIGDVSVKERIIKFDEYEKGKTKICFDHHINTTNIENVIYWHEPTYPASSLQAIEIIKNLTDINKLSEKTSLFLLFGILTDTGFFKYSLSNPKPPQYFSELLNNISNDRIDELYRGMTLRTKEDIKIQKYLFSHIIFKGNLTYVKVPFKDVEKFGSIKIKTKINFIANIEGSNIWMFILETREIKDFPWKVSIRSNKYNVRDVAVKFNGGGHNRAAGAKLRNKKEVNQIIQELLKIK